ncbi:MAG: hypothetical protein M0D54_10740 [Hyphomonadaceae bacterium JAD_PAG50586_4]|nr:MAG: hypothetical protein M0D54_10740 [Hyphomonadaceae bacterium JAD_PAG50586_4]
MLLMVTGFSGAGKSAAIDILKDLTGGHVIYLGGEVIREVERRGLPSGAASERAVRKELRQAKGDAVFAVNATDEIRSARAADRAALIDAVLCPDELKYFIALGRDLGGTCLLLLDTKFDLRAERLSRRQNRPCDVTALRLRDELERESLSIEAVFAEVDARINNDGDFSQLRAALAVLAKR